MIDLFVFSLKNTFRKGFRSILTVLGIAVGVASVIIISTINQVGIKAINSELDSLGMNGLAVTSVANNVITNDDVKTVEKVDCVKSVSPVITHYSYAFSFDKRMEIVLWGVSNGAKQVISFDMICGNAFDETQVEARENVCLVDSSVAKKFYGRENIVGKSIKMLVGGIYEEFKVIGITKQGSGILQSMMGDSVPAFCYIPYTTYQALLNTTQINEIAVRLNQNADEKLSAEKITNTLDNARNSDGEIETKNLSSQRDSLSNLLSIITVILSVVGFVSLAVAGLGIMTVMLVSVNERTREIGIKKAIGASFKIIMNEFLMEALFISLLGSVVGCALGVIACKIGELLYNIDVTLSFNSFVVGILGALIIGIVFGIYPAYKGAKLQPIKALRYE